MTKISQRISSRLKAAGKWIIPQLGHDKESFKMPRLDGSLARHFGDFCSGFLMETSLECSRFLLLCHSYSQFAALHPVDPLLKNKLF